MSKPNRRWRDPEVVRQQRQLDPHDALVAHLAGSPCDLLDPDDDRTVDERICDAVHLGLMRWEDWVSPEDMARSKSDAQARYEELIALDRLEYGRK